VVSYPRSQLGFCGSVRLATRLNNHERVNDDEQGAPVWICGDPRAGEALGLLPAVPSNVTQTNRGTPAPFIASPRSRVPSSSRVLAWRGLGVPRTVTTGSGRFAARVAR
jgi:hypothetical protein